MDIKRVSRYTSLSVNMLYEWASQGKIPSVKLGRIVLFDLNDIDALMASMKRNTNQVEEASDKIIGDLLMNEI
ncbi:MAG: helix-turn-helix domain-containing protein [Candidatus Scalindua sp.]|nr:helix-turn-helix domain-containing protein [Candidatus Scalindua sp.]